MALKTMRILQKMAILDFNCLGIINIYCILGGFIGCDVDANRVIAGKTIADAITFLGHGPETCAQPGEIDQLVLVCVVQEGRRLKLVVS